MKGSRIFRYSVVMSEREFVWELRKREKTRTVRVNRFKTRINLGRGGERRHFNLYRSLLVCWCH